MPVDTDETFVAPPTTSELDRRAMEMVGFLLAAGMRLENRIKSVPRVRIRLFDGPDSSR
jgi:hypothetical protein